MNRSIHTLYFSATGTTKKIVTGIADRLAEDWGCKINETVDVTLPDARKEPASFSERDLVIVGFPVYAGRVPNILVKFLNTIRGNGAMAVAVVVYGNRHYDDALIELKDILEADGFQVIACGAFIGEHSFSRILGQNRPDEQDLSVAAEFARQISQKLTARTEFEPINVPGNRPYKPYYMPKDKDDKPAPIHKVIPKTNSDCIDCKLCAELCPMGSINAEHVSELNGICIKCCACIKNCPVQAKYFDDVNYLRHKQELEDAFTSPRREPAYFL